MKQTPDLECPENLPLIMKNCEWQLVARKRNLAGKYLNIATPDRGCSDMVVACAITVASWDACESLIVESFFH